MPKLGAATSSAKVSRGCIIPDGSLDTFKTALQAHASQLVEVAVIGDSTSYGNDDDESTWYPWLRRLRDNMTAVGVTHGGTGLFHNNDYTTGAQATFAEGGYPIVSATSGWTNIATIGGVNGFASTATGTITFQGKGTAVRLNLGKLSTGGKIGYTVNGGSETLTDTLIQLPAANAYDVQPVLVSGLTEGTNTVVVRNAGLSSILPPSGLTINTAGGGTTAPPAGTYFYKVTAVSVNGESLPVAAPNGVTVNGAQFPQVVVTAQYGWTDVKLYRATTVNGTYGLVTTVTGVTAGNAIGINDGTVGGTPGAAPPGSSTLGTYASANRTEVGIEFIRAAGVVLHKEASAGQVVSGYFDHVNNAATTRSYAPIMLGLKTENQATSVNGYMWGLPQGTKPTYRNTKLTIIQLGTNDIGSASPATDGSTMTNWNNYFENLGYAIRTIRAAGSDCLIVSPPFTHATDPGAQHYSARFKSALLSLALSHGCAYVDFQEALGWDVANFPSRDYGQGGVGHPHLHITGYQAEADFLWTNVFQPLLQA